MRVGDQRVKHSCFSTVQNSESEKDAQHSAALMVPYSTVAPIFLKWNVFEIARRLQSGLFSLIRERDLLKDVT